MFLHLGGDVITLKKNIIAIIDVEAQKSAVTREFFDTAFEEGFIVHIAPKGKEKSYVITSREIYLSPISCSTLKKRSMEIANWAEDHKLPGLTEE